MVNCQGIIQGLVLWAVATLAARALETSGPLAPSHRRAFQPRPAGGELVLRLEQVASGLDQPIYVTAPPSGGGLYVIERSGCIRVIEHGDVRPEPFLDLRGEIDWAGERGLLGLAFSPDYAASGRCYVAYTEKTTMATVVARFIADSARERLRPSSREEILRIPQVEGRIDHKAGWLGFRPGEPNYLYIHSGDGGGHHDPDNSAQDLASRRGKILRVDVSGTGPGFAVPPDNPFVDRPGALPEIWAYGVRNPFRGSFERATIILAMSGRTRTRSSTSNRRALPAAATTAGGFSRAPSAHGSIPTLTTTA
jgi:glucose/arabinose dehydrogenase